MLSDDPSLTAILDNPLPPLLPPENCSSVAPFADTVTAFYNQYVMMAGLSARLKKCGYT